MAFIRDPNWTGPGPGPLIEVPDEPSTVAPSDIPSFEDLFRRAYPDVQTLTPQEMEQLASGTYVPPTDTLDTTKPDTTTTEIERIAALDRESRERIAALDRQSAERIAALNRPASSGADAFLLLKTALEELGLAGLDGQLRDLLARNITKSDDVLFYLRDTEQYKTRFRANEGRKQKGLAQLLPAAYIALEQQYRATLIANGFDPTLYDEYTDFQNLIAGDVSNAELQNRINEGYRQVADADPEVVRQMKELYNVDSAQLAQYFLDPAKTLPKLKQQAAAANVAARAKEQGKLQLTPVTAEELVSRGYTEAQAQQAFSMLSEKAGLFNEMMGEETLTEQQKIGAAFGYDVASGQVIERRGARRKAPFQGGGGFASTTGATSGTRQTGLGVAE